MAPSVRSQTVLVATRSTPWSVALRPRIQPSSAWS